MSQETSMQEEAYISLNVPNYHKWLDYFLRNKKEAIMEMTQEMAAAKNPSYKMIDRFIWALLEYEEKDMPFILETFKKYMRPYRGNKDYNKYYLKILQEINLEGAYNAALSMIDAGALEVLPIFAKILARRKNIDDLLKFNALPETREALLDPIFRESYPDSSYLEEFLFSIPPDSLSDWERQILVKWLNMHQSYAYADILSSLDVDNKLASPPPRGPEFILDRAIQVAAAPDYRKNQPLLMIFSSFMPHATANHFKQNGIENLELLRNTREFEGKKIFSRYAHMHIIHVLDEFDIWGFFHIPQYLYHLKRIIHSLKPSKIMTFGVSAGGFGSLLFGTLLNADLSMAAIPQTFAFHDWMTPFRQGLCKRHKFLFNPHTCLSRIMRQQENKTIKSIYYSKNCDLDTFHAGLLAGIDDRTIFHAQDGGTQHVFDSLDKAETIANLYDDIARYCDVVP